VGARWLRVAAGVTVSITHSCLVLTIAATIGVISPSGNEVGPFLSIEQAARSNVVSEQRGRMVLHGTRLLGVVRDRTRGLICGFIVQVLQKATMAPLDSYRMVVVLYAVLGVLRLFFVNRLTSSAEVSLQKESDISAGLPKFLASPIHTASG